MQSKVSSPYSGSKIHDLMQQHRQQVVSALESWLPAADSSPGNLHQAMRYAVLGSGKYLRPLLVYATGTSLGVDSKKLDAPASAVELIHAYSLIHDDLPAMDDDDLRRGRNTCHREFDEATAILAGDALQPLAFHLLSCDHSLNVDAEIRLRMVDTLATASGSIGMAGGQALDLAAEGKAINLEELEDLHLRKTGALIRASILLGMLSAGHDVSPVQQESLKQYAHAIGLAYQVQDDILDVTGSTEVLGKQAGADQLLQKSTFVSLLGLEVAQEKVKTLYQQAIDAIEILPERADYLRELAWQITNRDR